MEGERRMVSGHCVAVRREEGVMSGGKSGFCVLGRGEEGDFVR